MLQNPFPCLERMLGEETALHLTNTCAWVTNHAGTGRLSTTTTAMTECFLTVRANRLLLLTLQPVTVILLTRLRHYAFFLLFLPHLLLKKREKKHHQLIFFNFFSQFPQDPNKKAAKVAASGDKLTNHSQLLAAFGWWRVLISYPGKNQLSNR